MGEATVAGPLGALRAVIDDLWDERVGMSRLAPGSHPGADLAGFDLHPIRETALGAILDLRDGRDDRAVTAIRSVLTHQRDTSTQPWSSTFKLTAEEPPPPPEPVEWLHYDPNWRQFIGCVLACALELHGAAIDPATRTSMETAIERAVRGEPEGRIPIWYTNPALMHAWLSAWVGARSGDASLVAAGEALATRLAARVERHGDVDEYNSPTYDGIDLFALALWQRFAPTAWFAEQGARIASTVGARMSTLFHPGLGAICGPYIRAYGISLDRYVSLGGQCLALAGADVSAVLPPTLDAQTDHVHDLWFLPLLDELADVIVPHLAIRDVDELRHHVQRFGSVVATSVLDAGSALGAESGRVHEFARDQYVPFAAHVADGGATRSLGVLLADSTARADCDVTGGREAQLQIVGRAGTTGMCVLASEEPSLKGRVLELGPLRMELSSPPAGVTTRPVSTGTSVELSWDDPGVAAYVRLR